MNQKPIFLIITDSVALPRKHESGFVLWNETYIAKIKIAYPNFDVINVSIGGASIKDLRNQINYYKILNPEIVLFQCGIVDAAPRAFGRIEMDIIKKLKLFRLTKPFVSFLRKFRSHHYASPKKFEETLLDIKMTLTAKQFYTLGILPSCTAYERVLPGISKSINEYNNILKRHTKFINLNEMPREGILDDFHHINRTGQEYIFIQIQKYISG
ncbi:hypothetical protein [Flavobacterium sp.]|uniref:hypothetical protein n=1 Tax=Flavobacterium sp. TaxID=239 RepID=UPI00391CD834